MVCPYEPRSEEVTWSFSSFHLVNTSDVITENSGPPQLHSLLRLITITQNDYNFYPSKNTIL